MNDVKLAKYMLPGVAALVMALPSGCSTVLKPVSSAPVHHVVLCWLKDQGNTDHRRQIIEASLTFREIPGVRKVQAGQVVSSDRPIVDDSFDVAILVTLESAENMEGYLQHPLHEAAKINTLVPFARRVVVYDFAE